jgi:hypothetical protein
MLRRVTTVSARRCLNTFRYRCCGPSSCAPIGRWRLHSVKLIAFSDIPESHQRVRDRAGAAILRAPIRAERKAEFRYKLAILVDPEKSTRPRIKARLRRFIRAAARSTSPLRLIRRRDLGRIAEYDALFIRETTRVNHHTYRFARRAPRPRAWSSSTTRVDRALHQQGLSGGALRAARDPVPAHDDRAQRQRRPVGAELGFPCVLKQPDSSFSPAS